jgi:outer membrane biosynthesis protein TonB
VIDRAEATGLGVATAGHLALLAALTFGLATAQIPASKSDPIEVSFVDEVGLQSASPDPAAEAPAPLLAPEEGPPAPAMPAPPEAQPVPRPEPPTRAPAPAPDPAARPAPPRASPTPPKPAPSKPAPAAKPAPSKPAQAAKPAATRSTGRLAGLLNGVSDRASDSRATSPPAAVMSARAAAGIGSLIRRQVQPCADRMVSPGPGASRIKVRINLKLNRNGSLRAPPSVEGVSGLDEENRRYAQRVKEMAVAAFTSCSPLRDLPPDLYAVSNGWSDFDMNYNLP